MPYDPYNPPTQKPRFGLGSQAQYPQNQGMLDALGRFQQQNAAIAARPPMQPYGLRAMQAYQPQYQQRQAIGIGGAPIGQSNSGLYAQSPGPGYAESMQPAWFQGAAPGQVAYSGGLRQGFQGGPPAGERMMAGPDRAAFAQSHGLQYNPATGVLGGNSPAANLTQAQFSVAGITGRSPYQRGLTPQDATSGLMAAQQGLATRQQTARQQVMNRVGIRGQNAQEKQQQALAMQQQQQMMGLMAFYPALGMQMAQMQQRGQIAQGQLGLQQQQLQQQGLLGSQQSADRRYVADSGLLAAQHRSWSANYAQAIKDGHTPDDAARLAGPPPAAPQVGGLSGVPQQSVPGAPQAGGLLGAAKPGARTAGPYSPRKQLLDSQLSALAGIPASKREAALRGMGVTDPNDLNHYQTQLNPLHGQPSFSQNIASMQPDDSAAGQIGTALNPYGRFGALAGVLGIHAPPLVRPTRPSARLRPLH